jgi:hypothetical protein
MKKIAAIVMLVGAVQWAQAQNGLGSLFNNMPAVPAKVADLKAKQPTPKEAQPANGSSSTTTPGASAAPSTQMASQVEAPAAVKAHTEALAAYRKKMDELAAANPITSTSDMANASPEETAALENMGKLSAKIIEKFNDFYKISNGLVTKFAPKNFASDCAAFGARENDLNAFSAEFNAEFGKIRGEVGPLFTEFDAAYKIAVASKSATLRSRAVAQTIQLLNPVQSANGTVMEISKEMAALGMQKASMNCK